MRKESMSRNSLDAGGSRGTCPRAGFLCVATTLLWIQTNVLITKIYKKKEKRKKNGLNASPPNYNSTGVYINFAEDTQYIRLRSRSGFVEVSCYSEMCGSGRNRRASASPSLSYSCFPFLWFP